MTARASVGGFSSAERAAVRQRAAELRAESAPAKGKVVVFFKPAAKFDTRYGTIGFSHDAVLDDGPMWATEFAVVETNEAVTKQLRDLVKKATE